MTVYFSELNCVMPREKDPVWRDFTEVLINGVKRAKCKKCGVDQCAIVQRMKEHACAKEEHESVQTTPSQKISQIAPQDFVEFVAKRRKMAMSDVMLAANLLDHRYKGQQMDALEVATARRYILAINDECAPDLAKYMAKELPYTSDLFEGANQGVNPGTWWRSGKQLGFSDSMVSTAEGIVSGIGSSAGLERQFSTLGMNYGKLRSSLGVEKAGKLAFLYRQLNQS